MSESGWGIKADERFVLEAINDDQREKNLDQLRTFRTAQAWLAILGVVGIVAGQVFRMPSMFSAWFFLLYLFFEVKRTKSESDIRLLMLFEKLKQSGSTTTTI